MVCVFLLQLNKYQMMGILWFKTTFYLFVSLSLCIRENLAVLWKTYIEEHNVLLKSSYGIFMLVEIFNRASLEKRRAH